MTPAGFWVRALALAIDVVVFFVARRGLRLVAALMVVGDGGWSARGAIAFFMLLFSAMYTTVLHAITGQTIGKNLVGIRVVGTDGRLLTFGAALLRYGGYYGSLLPFTLGFIMAGLRRDKRALHDLIAGSRVEWLPVTAPVVSDLPDEPGPATRLDAAVAAEPSPPGESDVLGVPPVGRDAPPGGGDRAPLA
jgi:uncharacterized RDD family membrane protein YckC